MLESADHETKMGRTVPTFVQFIQDGAEHWKNFRRSSGERTSRISTDCSLAYARTPKPPPTSVTAIRWRPSFFLSPSTKKSGSTPWRKLSQTQRCFVKLCQGWILDLYPNKDRMTLWLIDRNQSHYHLTDSFAPGFYVSGDHERLVHLQEAVHKQTTELPNTVYRAHRPVAHGGRLILLVAHAALPASNWWTCSFQKWRSITQSS